jgi:hypothetical protein
MTRWRELFSRRSAPDSAPARDSNEILNKIIAHIVVPMFVLDRDGR